MVSWTVGGFRVALIATRGRNEQQWYAYDKTSFCTLGKTSGDGNSLSFGLLNVFKCKRCCRPVVGSFAKILLPKFKSSKRSKFLNASSSMKLISLPSKSLKIRWLQQNAFCLIWFFCLQQLQFRYPIESIIWYRSNFIIGH